MTHGKKQLLAFGNLLNSGVANAWSDSLGKPPQGGFLMVKI